jgi:glycosyltransferase 2 family protein
MDGIVDATRAFFDGLASVRWGPLALAVLCHLLKVAARSRAWRNIVQAAYPRTTVRWRDVYGAYVAGVGVNSILPARGGDVLKLYLLRHRVRGSSYPTLASTLLVDTLFDAVVASVLVSWALAFGLLPGLDVVPRLPAIDWLYLFQHPRLAVAVAVALVILVVFGMTWGTRKVMDFWARVRQGFTILREPRDYLRRVVLWDLVDWSLRLASVFFFLRAFGIPSGAQDVALVQTTMSLATALPFTPGGVGTEQALLLYVFRGEAAVPALLSFSIGMKIVLTVVNVVVGFGALLLMLGGFRWRHHVERDRGAIEAG